MAADYETLPIRALFESATNPRRRFDSDAHAEMVKSVREHGILQPILVRRSAGDEADDVRYEVVAGARRFRAAKEAHLDLVPCIVRALDDRQVLEVQFIENLQRQDLHPLDEGIGYQKLVDDHGYTVEELAGKLGKSRSYVYGRMQLTKLPVEAQTLFFEGKIDASLALLVSRIPDPKLANKAAEEIAAGFPHQGAPMSYRVAVEHVRRNYQLDLEHAAFDPADKSLVLDAGACGPCPRRTGNQKDLFGGVDGKAAQLCTDPGCFALKTAEHWRRVEERILAEGGRVLAGKAADNARYGPDYIDPKDCVVEDYEERRSWETVCRGQKVTQVLLRPRHGDPVVRWDREEAIAAAAANGHEWAKPTKQQAEARKEKAPKPAESPESRAALEQAALPVIVAAAEALKPAAALRMVIRVGLAFGASIAVGRRRGIDFVNLGRPGMVGSAANAKLQAMKVPQLQGLVAELLADFQGIEEVAEELGVDLAKVAKQLEKDRKAKEKAAATAAKAPAKKAKGKAAVKVELPKGADPYAGSRQRRGSRSTGD